MTPGAAVAASGLIALAVALGIGRFAFTPILPMMQADAGLSIAPGGWLAAANYGGYLVGALIAVRIRVPSSRAIRGSLVVIALATLGMGLEHRFAAWVLLRTVAGIASAWVLIFVSAWSLGTLAPLGRPILNGVVFAGVGTGIALAGGACVLLMYVGATSTRAWLVLGVLALVGTALIWRPVGGEAGVRTGRATPASRGRQRWDSDSARLVLCYGAFGFGYIIPATFLPAMARAMIRDPMIFGWSWPVFGAAAAASTLAVARAASVIGNRRLWRLGQTVMAVGIALPVVVPGMAAIMLAALFVGGTFMVITMTGLQEARHVAGPEATPLMAAMTAAFAAGQIVGPLAVSYLVGADADFSRPLLVAAVALLASALALANRPGSLYNSAR